MAFAVVAGAPPRDGTELGLQRARPGHFLAPRAALDNPHPPRYSTALASHPPPAQPNPGRSSAWTERCVRDAEVAGSNPVAPMTEGWPPGRPSVILATGRTSDRGFAAGEDARSLVHAEVLSERSESKGEGAPKGNPVAPIGRADCQERTIGPALCHGRTLRPIPVRPLVSPRPCRLNPVWPIEDRDGQDRSGVCATTGATGNANWSVCAQRDCQTRLAAVGFPSRSAAG